MYHWDIPQVLSYLGSFNNPQLVDYMVDYADLLFQLYGDRVKTWLTINEPLTFCAHFPNATYKVYGDTVPVGVTEYMCSHNVLKAHMRIYRLYQLKYKETQGGNYGIRRKMKCL